jgi:hypothetical protein
MKIGADTHALGTRRDVYSPGYEWAGHSMFPEPMCDLDEARVLVGGPACKQPYSAALLNISAMSYGSLSGSAVSAPAAESHETADSPGDARPPLRQPSEVHTRARPSTPAG